MINNGFYEKELKKVGIKIVSLNIKNINSFFENIKKLLKVRELIKKQNPDIIQSWMYHSNFLTIFFQREFRDKIFWNIRHTVLNLNMSKKTTILVSIFCGLFSRYVPKKIIYCSEKSINFHENRHFYARNKTILVENGYSDKAYYPSKYLRKNFRKSTYF